MRTPVETTVERSVAVAHVVRVARALVTQWCTRSRYTSQWQQCVNELGGDRRWWCVVVMCAARTLGRRAHASCRATRQRGASRGGRQLRRATSESTQRVHLVGGCDGACEDKRCLCGWRSRDWTEGLGNRSSLSCQAIAGNVTFHQSPRYLGDQLARARVSTTASVLSPLFPLNWFELSPLSWYPAQPIKKQYFRAILMWW